MKTYVILLGLSLILFSCKNTADKTDSNNTTMEKDYTRYATVKLNSDISHLSSGQIKMLSLFFEVSDIMDRLFWDQAFGNKQALLDTIDSPEVREFIKINYGPWNRLNGHKPFVEGAGEKPLGANFYPQDMSKEEFEAFGDSTKNSLYTIIRRKNNGELKAIPYHEYYQKELQKASDLLSEAAKFAQDEGFRKYLELRSDALLNSNYTASDMAWMDMKSNLIDFIVGPIENYEDQLWGLKAAFEAFILIKDPNWSARLDKYSNLLPALQKKLPVSDKYKNDSDLGAYDAIYYAGDCNAGAKTIAINLPNDEEVQLIKGSRRLQLKNSMKAKFDSILLPISNILIADKQIKNVTFDAFFENVMFHEVAHGLGMKNTVNDKGTVREALKEKYSIMEEGKADILGVFLVNELNTMGELNIEIMDNYVTFMAGIFRSVRFGSSSSHGIANLIRYNYFKELGAFSKNEEGKYVVDKTKFEKAMTKLSNNILEIQGDGNYDEAIAFIEKYGNVPPSLKHDLDQIDEANIPVDVIFEQGKAVIGIED